MKDYFRNIYQAIVTILIGMGVTFRHLFVHAVTIQYPHVKRELPARSRQKLFVNIDDCIGCFQCARACPVDCIMIETVKAGKDEDLGETSNGQKKRLHVVKFDIDMAKCCYCADCVFPCPTECIYMTPDYEFATYDRNSLLLHFAKYSPEQVKALHERQEKEALAKAQAAKIKAAAGTKKPESET
ncbi:NAD(P)H-quinone oxidoreductase subunit I [bacterium BMS3Abin05]|nr:NAD(P)H-quinone oxidoreductase subunit I [bacterium BMS3Abin05]GBE27206.1 NAD(P)H-quinone oxidoreductase subunit I [bacterium BMS3Bbin03]HDZ12023.1 NADH-quinone oxidoreductase subunit I [Bacteroidota bacterium]